MLHRKSEIEASLAAFSLPKKFLLLHTLFYPFIIAPKASFIEYRSASLSTNHFATFIAPFEKVFLAVAV